MDAKHCCSVALLVCLSAGAFAYPRPLPGTEDIPKMMADSGLVCKGEVVEAPTPKVSPPAGVSDLTAIVRSDRCFKGSLTGSSIPILFDGFISMGPSFILRKNDYRLFFLKPQDGAYVVVNRWFGALPVSRELGPVSGSGDDMFDLEQDLKAGLRDPNQELVLDSIQMLGNMKHLRSTSELTALLDSSDLLTKTYVWQALLRLKDYSVLPSVSEFFESQPEPPRQVTLPRDQLFEMEFELINEVDPLRDHPETLPFLEHFAVNGKLPTLRMNALQALRAINSPHSAPTFLNALDDANPTNAYSAMQGLLSLAGPGRIDWVPTRKQFDETPTLYTAKCREWWQAEGQQRMLSKDSARRF